MPSQMQPLNVLNPSLLSMGSKLNAVFHLDNTIARRRQSAVFRLGAAIDQRRRLRSHGGASLAAFSAILRRARRRKRKRRDLRIQFVPGEVGKEPLERFVRGGQLHLLTPDDRRFFDHPGHRGCTAGSGRSSTRTRATGTRHFHGRHSEHCVRDGGLRRALRQGQTVPEQRWRVGACRGRLDAGLHHEVHLRHAVLFPRLFGLRPSLAVPGGLHSGHHGSTCWHNPGATST